MKSPFPGMDPFIESARLWEEFHYHFVADIASLLANAVPPQYLVKTGERAYIVLLDAEEENGKTEHLIKPDAGIGVSRGVKTQPATATQEPRTETDTDIITLRSLASESFRESFVEIYSEPPERELVTCIEVLSPTNKRFGSEGWDLYLRKRQAMLLGQANFVEMDLLRGGRKMPMLDPWPECPYTILASRRQRAPHCRVWKAYMHKPLPAIKVPLLADDPQVPLELQPIVDSIYRRFHYDKQIDYGKPCSPPLTTDETACLDVEVKKRE
jgi:hypothetical protein